MCDEKWRLLPAFGVVLWVTSCTFMLYFGSTGVITANEWKAEMTKEKCYIMKRTEEECSYECNCSSNDDGSESCWTCWGLQYDYEAVAYDKCGDASLSTLTSSVCDPSDVKNIGKEYTCFVLDCHESGFIFEHPNSYLAGSIILLIFGCLLLIIPTIVICYCISKR